MNTARSIQLSSKVKVSLDEILHGISKLDVNELEDFLQKLGNVVASRKSPHLTVRETELLLAINQPVPEAQQTAYERLAEKMRAETITPQEHQELLKVIEFIEQFHVNRLQKLIGLSQYRGITLDELLRQLSISLSKRA
jgi:hypothetical protein